jgi:hypothetical protein
MRFFSLINVIINDTMMTIADFLRSLGLFRRRVDEIAAPVVSDIICSFSSDPRAEGLLMLMYVSSQPNNIGL